MHPFCSSHEEKRDCVRLSMGGQSWSSSRSISGGMASSRERKRREGHGWGCGLGRGRAVGGRHGGSALHAVVPLACCCATRVRRNTNEEEEKREEKKRKEKKREKKKKIWKIFHT
jgi:hypothetical protein